MERALQQCVEKKPPKIVLSRSNEAAKMKKFPSRLTPNQSTLRARKVNYVLLTVSPYSNNSRSYCSLFSGFYFALDTWRMNKIVTVRLH